VSLTTYADNQLNKISYIIPSLSPSNGLLQLAATIRITLVATIAATMMIIISVALSLASNPVFRLNVIFRWTSNNQQLESTIEKQSKNEFDSAVVLSSSLCALTLIAKWCLLKNKKNMQNDLNFIKQFRKIICST